MEIPRVPSAIFDEKAETEAFGRILLPHLEAGFRQGIDNVRGGRAAATDVFGDYVRDAIRRKAYAHAALAVGTTKEQLQKLLIEAIDEGLGVQDLARNIRRMFDVDSKTRSLRIARTELTDSINDGSNHTLRAEGFQQKEWSTVIDGQERPDHHAANGQQVGIHEAFRVGGESARYPGDEMLSPKNRVNCRCLIVGAGLDEAATRRAGRVFLRAHGALERGLVVSLRRAFLSQRDRVLSNLAP